MPENNSLLLPQWTLGYPPSDEPCYLACRKWSGTLNGKYLEVVAGDPAPYLAHLGIAAVLKPGFTGIFGRVIRRGELPYIVNEHGAPTGFYPDCVLAWSPPPQVLLDLQAAASARMVLGQAKGGKG